MVFFNETKTPCQCVSESKAGITLKSINYHTPNKGNTEKHNEAADEISTPILNILFAKTIFYLHGTQSSF